MIFVSFQFIQDSIATTSSNHILHSPIPLATGLHSLLVSTINLTNDIEQSVSIALICFYHKRRKGKYKSGILNTDYFADCDSLDNEAFGNKDISTSSAFAPFLSGSTVIE